MPKLTIDGRTLAVAEGTTVLRAALEASISIPHLCWHPAFPPEGSCRLCLVEIEGFPKLELACSTAVREGMKVRTETPAVRESRRRVLEFLLADHPVDCPICDKAGECKLQDYYEDHGLTESVFREEKERRPKNIDLGKNLLLDRERCVLCTRCVRFLREVTRTGELGVFERGVRSEIGILEGRPVATPYGGNLVDLCPVGAITDRSFRFRTRTWFLVSRPTICPLCARGCAIDIDHHPGLPRRADSAGVFRVRPRPDEAVNGFWICDLGRYGYLDLHRRRLTRISWNRGGPAAEMSRAKILSVLGGKIREMAVRGRSSRLGLVLNSGLTVEELRSVRDGLLSRLPEARLWFDDPPPGEDDGFLLRAERTANRRGAAGLGFDLAPFDPAVLGKDLDIILVFGGLSVGKGRDEVLGQALASIGTKVLLSPVETGLEPAFDFLIPTALPSEKSGTFINVDGLARSFEPAIPVAAGVWPEGEFLAALAEEISRGA
ncbi:MAG: 2Fe-2S iron-sulfur cluster binding domain-containing protein [Candidatus Aminicenantes bacterium]|nr:2Fe-2S iron-sulfur cluster binding domain-containing protein [Candidatus Aminicenantes bacterium]